MWLLVLTGSGLPVPAPMAQSKSVRLQVTPLLEFSKAVLARCGVQRGVGGQALITGSDDHTARIWNVSSGQLIQKFKHQDFIRHVTFSPSGLTLASSGAAAAIKLWDVRTGKPLQTLRGHLDWVRSVAFSPNGSSLISSSDDGKLRVWNLERLGQ